MIKNTINTVFVLIGSGRCGLQPGKGEKVRAWVKGIRELEKQRQEVIFNFETRNKSKNQTIL